MKKLLMAIGLSIPLCLCAESKNDCIEMLSYEYKEIITKKHNWEKEHPNLMKIIEISYPLTMMGIQLDQRYYEIVIKMQNLSEDEENTLEIENLYIETLGYFKCMEDVIRSYEGFH